MKSMIKSISRFTILLLVLLSTAGVNKVLASHFAGADLYIDFIGADSTQLKYRINLWVYKACEPNNSSLYATETVSWKIGNAAGPAVGSRILNEGVEDTLDQLCDTSLIVNSCRQSGSIYPGFVRALYTDTITLPSKDANWVFWWSDGSRNAGVTNLSGAGGYNIYIEAGLNNTGAHWANSTPRYLIDPVPYLCVNQPNIYLNGPIDPDLDSLVTLNLWPSGAFAPPRAGSLIPYAGGFTLANPINSTVANPYRVIAGTGTAFFTPQGTGKFVLAFQTSSFDRYSKEPLGYITRDVQVSVLSCNAPPPAIDTIPLNVTGGTVLNATAGSTTISICPNATVTFQVNAHSTATTNYVALSANNAATANGSTFTVTHAGGIATGTFSWTPVTSDIGDHVIIVETRDSSCSLAQPLILKNYLVVTIRVLPGLDAGPDQKICPLGDNPVVIRVSGPQTNIYNWRAYGGGPSSAQYIDCLNCPVVNVTPPVTYTYVVYSGDPLFVCKSTDTVVVTVDNSNSIEATQDPLVVCRPGYVTFTSNPVGPNPVSNLPCGTSNPQLCTTPAQITIGTTGNTSSDPTNTPFNTVSQYQKYQFIINKAELRNAGLYSGTLSSISFKSNNPVVLGSGVLSNVRVGLKCTRNSKYPNSVSNVDFETGSTTVANVATFNIAPGGWNTIAFTTPYNWDTTQNLLVDICIGSAAVPPNAAGLDPVDMVPGQAIVRSSNTTDVCAANASAIALYTQHPVVRFDYCQAPDLPFTFRWAPGTYLSDSTVQNPVAYVPASGKYAVISYGRNGCKLVDTLHITVPIHTLTLDPRDTALCVGQPGQFRATGAAGGYLWYQNGYNTPTTLSCNNCANPVFTATTAGNYLITVVYLDPDNCFDTLSTNVLVHPLPNVKIVNNDTTITYGQHVNLMVNGANQYTWTPTSSLDDPNIPNPVATPHQNTTYIVYGLTQYQCSSTDTVTINVDTRANLLIPSGFTPNGDGRNDVFKVVNVTFQKLMEFRVFNRWGQEVFSSTDAAKGWDGRWKGVDQDMGTYSYIIRVAFPDGIVETYKGEVTLIR